ncbi:hypothetical protein [Streptomyces cirratus]|uniref:hypothetical protein n=1 Tax=Streptomyces cirratus TaxID=68187 RepID=UPI003621A71B
MKLLQPAARPATLRGRLSLLAVATAAFVMAVFTIAFNAFVHQHLARQADDQLRARASAIAATVDTSGPVLRVLETPQEGLLDANAWIYQGTTLVEQPPPPRRTAQPPGRPPVSQRRAAPGAPPRRTARWASGSAPGRCRHRPAVPGPRPWSPRSTSPRTVRRPTPCCWPPWRWTPSCSPARTR